MAGPPSIPAGGIRIPPIPPIPTGPQPPGEAPEWEAYRPALNIFRNGQKTNEAGVILTPPGPGPFMDVNHPTHPTYTHGNPTGNSDIDFDGFALGWNPATIQPNTPPSGEFVHHLEPIPPPDDNGPEPIAASSAPPPPRRSPPPPPSRSKK